MSCSILLTRAGFLAGFLLLLAACASKPIEVTHNDVVDLSDSLEDKPFDAPYDPGLGQIRLALAQVSCAVAITGRKSEFEEATRSQLTRLLVQTENFTLASRSATAEAQAEWALVANDAANPGTVPVSPGVTVPQYLLKATIVQVERNIRGSGEDREWTLYWAARSSEQRREGAVAIEVEVVDLATLQTLYDVKTSSGGYFLGIGGGSTDTVRVPESQAIRAACEAAVRDIHAYFVKARSSTREGS